MIRFTVLPAKAPAGDCAARLRRSSRPRPRKPCPSRARWLISPSPATGSSEGARPSAFEMTHEPPPRMRIGAICAFVILTPYAAPLLGPLSRPPGLRGKNAGRDWAANCAAVVYRRRSGSARGDLLRRQRAAGGSDRASDRSRHRPPARTGRDRLLLPFRVGHGVAGRTIDPIDDLLRGPGRSEQPARIERDHTRRGFGGRRKFWSADQEIRAGDRAGAMEFEHGARSLAARSS